MSDKDLKKIKEIRKRRMRQLVDEEYGTQAALAEKLKREPSYISRILSGNRGMEEGLAREFEIILGKPKYWFDNDPDSDSTEPETAAQDDEVTLLISPDQYRLIRAWHLAEFAENEKLRASLKKTLISAAETVEELAPQTEYKLPQTIPAGAKIFDSRERGPSPKKGGSKKGKRRK